FMDDVKYGFGLLMSNLVPAVMIMAVPLVGAAVLRLPFLIIGGGLMGVGAGLGGLVSLSGFIAFPAAFYFVAQAHLGTSVSWLDAYKAVLGRGGASIVSLIVAFIIGGLLGPLTFFPLGFFVG